MQAIKQLVFLGALVTIATAQNFFPHFVQQQPQVAAQPQPAPLFYTQTIQFPHLAAPSVPAPAPAPVAAQTNVAQTSGGQNTGIAAPAPATVQAQAPVAAAAPLAPSHYVTAFGLDNVFAPFGFAQAPQPVANVASATNTAESSSNQGENGGTTGSSNGQGENGAASPAATHHGSHIHQAPASTAHLQASPFYAYPGYFPFAGPLPIQRALVSNAVNGQAQVQQNVAHSAPAPVQQQQPAPIAAYTVSNLPAGFTFPVSG